MDCDLSRVEIIGARLERVRFTYAAHQKENLKAGANPAPRRDHTRWQASAKQGEYRNKISCSTKNHR